MRAPPPVTQFVRFPVTSGVALMAIAVTILSHTGRSIEGLTMSVLAFEGQPWRLLTSALLHADVLHLAFNVLWLWVFGTAIEAVWGPLRTAAIFVLLAVGSTLAEYAVFSGGIGLSGVGYGLFGLLFVLARRDPRFAGTCDRRTVNVFAGWFVLCVVLTATHIMNIGNVAHASGAVLGLLLGLVLSGRVVGRLGAGAGIAAVLALGWLGGTTYRPVVNLSIDGGADSAQLGYELLGAGDNAEAVRQLRRAVEVSPDRSSSWYNLGLGLERMDDPETSVTALWRAYLIDPSDDQYRRALASVIGQVGVVRAKAGDVAGAIVVYGESVVLDPKNAISWYDLSLAFSKRGNWTAAVAAARRALELDGQGSHKTRVAETLYDAAGAAAMRGDDRSAVAMLREAITVGGKSADRYLALAAAYQRLGQSDAAQDAMSEAMHLEPARFQQRLEQNGD